MNSPPQLSYQTIAERARTLLPEIERLATQADYEPAGVPNSEMLFLLACLDGASFRALIESGRGRGQSTLMLSQAFPGHKITSIERNRDSPNAAYAQQRLQGRDNVELLFGDATKLLPQLVERGDVVLIDGPKGFRAVRLAIELLRSGKVAHVFVHDLTIETPERGFVARYFPEARFSDWRGFADVASKADAAIIEAIPPARRYDGFTGEFGYGYAMTYLPYVPGRPYGRLRWQALLADRLARLSDWLRPRPTAE
jgi:predicted O-methyltransferase YrrM